MTPAQASTTGRRGEAQQLRATFIIRLVREPSGAERTAWRGTVEHVQSGVRRAVPDAAGAAALLAGWLHELEQPAGPLPT